MLKEINGNLLDLFDQGEFNVIAHGCNCRGVMGGGIAFDIKRRYPEAHYEDMNCKIPFNRRRLGRATVASLSEDDIKLIFNLYTQVDPGPNAELTAILSSIRFMKDYLLAITESRKDIKIGIPLIGCGIGGLDWDKVSVLFKDVFFDFDITVVHYDGNTK
jgi:O-acetyl-ADP-ribose deacetylase (regulator of RNase III)